MKIQTFSIVAGSEACNARCPFCVSKMTVPHGIELKEPEVHWRNFRKGCLLAERSGVTTAMLTSKGEPTLFPDQITRYLEVLAEYRFPLIELQSNGIMLVEKQEKYRPYLEEWYRLGLTTIAISIVHYEDEPNRLVYLPHRKQYIDLVALVNLLHDHGFSVRLACIMAAGMIDAPGPLEKLADFARAVRAEQLTVRPVSRPDFERSRNQEVYQWTEEHALSHDQVQELAAFLERRARRLMTLSHGAVVYDLEGQNVCLTDCLTIDSRGEQLRQLIFFPDGHLRYDWQYAGAVLI